MSRTVIRLVACILACAVAAAVAPEARAESPPPATPSAPPVDPTPAPTPTAEAAPTSEPSGDPTPTADPERTSDPAGEPGPTPADAVDPARASAERERIEAMRRVIAATTLLERIEAQRRLAASERTFLERRIDEVRAEHEELVLAVAETRARADQRQAAIESLLRRAYRETHLSPLEVLLRRGSVVELIVHLDGLAALSEKERRLVLELRALQEELSARRDALRDRDAELTSLSETIAVKDERLTALAARAELLAAAAARDEGARVEAEIRVLEELAEEVIRAHAAEEEIVARLAKEAGARLAGPAAWVWPLLGRVTQEFGPSALVLEPPRVHGGVAFPHFHDGMDIAAPLGTVVRAAAAGTVAFVGHLPDGAMVVIIVHDDGAITLYGHLDDVHAAPQVRAGQRVEAGAPIGAVGLTGITTGPHLHFVVRRGEEPIDPRVVLPPPPDRDR